MDKKIIIALMTIPIILYTAWFFQQNKQTINNNMPSCTDSDGGKNVYTKGEAVYRGRNGRVLHVSTDSCGVRNEEKYGNETRYIRHGMRSCTGNNCSIFEAYCGEYMGSPINNVEVMKCPNGCNDGACNS